MVGLPVGHEVTGLPGRLRWAAGFACVETNGVCLGATETVMMMVSLMMTAIVLVVLIIVRHAQRRLQRREVITAIEQGQPLPMKPKRRRVCVDDMRTGVLLVSFSVGLFL